MPKVSINIVTYNRKKYLPEAIESVLIQSFPDWELIIVDDGSADETSVIVSEYASQEPRIKYIQNERNLGISRSRNIALNASSGQYVAVLDSDDAWADNDKLKKQIGFLDNNNGYVLAGGDVIFIDETGKKLKTVRNPKSDKAIRQHILLRNPFIHSTIIMRRNSAQQCGGYDENISVGEDYDLWLKLGRVGKMHNFPDIFAKYRFHSVGATWSNRLFSAREHLKVILEYKKVYPNFLWAWLKARARILLALCKN